VSSFDVRVWEVGKRTIRGKTWYRVRWSVDGRSFEELFRTKALANSARAELIKAMNAGEPFDPESGKRVASLRAEAATSWYRHARAYVAMKWPRAAARSRRSIVEALTDVTLLLVKPLRGRPAADTLRKAVYLYGLNPQRFAVRMAAEYAAALAWLEKASIGLDELEDVAVVRRVLDGLAVRQDGRAAAATTVRRKRAVFYNALGYAVELGLLSSNPVDRVQWRAPEVAEAIDRRVVANPQQVAALLDALESMGPRAGRMVAFFGCIYYAGMRPAEAAKLRWSDCHLPAEGWGLANLAETDSRAGRHWTDDGTTHERRGLKHRGRKETRPVPLPPALVELLLSHRERFGLAPDGRFFCGLRGGPLAESTYDRWWKLARVAALSPEQVASPPARRAYDLRHAAASLWLNAGVPPTEVARRLGHSVAVLLRVYANCIDGEISHHNDRIADALAGDRTGTSREHEATRKIDNYKSAGEGA